jgi:uncharacterized protein YggU (UPF0235/DUF167 family)
VAAAPGSELLARGHAAWPERLLLLSRLSVRLTPSGGADRIDGRATDSAGRSYLKARVRAAPENNQANRALEALIAKAFGVAKGKVSVARGHTARLKVLEIDGASEADIAAFMAGLDEA